MGTRSDVGMAHDFFYLCVGERYSQSYSSCAVSYDADGLRCFSYSTCIAKVIPRKGFSESDIDPRRVGTGLTLVSSTGMSPSTSRHVNNVISASPFNVVKVPMERGDRDVRPGKLADRILSDLAFLRGKLNLADNRNEFARLLSVRREIASYACDEWARPFNRKAFDRYEKMLPELDRIACEQKAKARKASALEAKRKRLADERAAAVRTKWLCERSGADYIGFLRAVFGCAGPGCGYAFRPSDAKVLRDAMLGDDHRTAYVWTEGEEVRTSKGIKMPVAAVRAALRAWSAGKDMRAFRIGDYAVVSYEGDTIQIGCHHIPRANAIALYETVIGKPFPGGKEARCGR